MIFVLIACALALGAFLYHRRAKRQARAALIASGLSEEERELVAKLVPLYARMPPDLQQKVDGKVNLFLDQVDFYGSGGLEVTEEMAFAVAAQACILVAGNDQWYDTLRTVLLYPGAFQSKQENQDGYVVTERRETRIGESWARGPVILSWAHSERGAFIDDDGHNVVFHEFAHQLDHLGGDTDGVPLLAKDQSYATWVRVFTEAYERANRLIEIGKEPFLDPYGATAPEELFAVATEAFFENPRTLRQHEPDIYEELRKFYGQDPASW
ncbi:MAG: M90 family metallopeptidase [Pseudomonadota bacterium]